LKKLLKTCFKKLKISRSIFIERLFWTMYCKIRAAGIFSRLVPTPILLIILSCSPEFFGGLETLVLCYGEYTEEAFPAAEVVVPGGEGC